MPINFTVLDMSIPLVGPESCFIADHPTMGLIGAVASTGSTEFINFVLGLDADELLITHHDAHKTLAGRHIKVPVLVDSIVQVSKSLEVTFKGTDGMSVLREWLDHFLELINERVKAKADASALTGQVLQQFMNKGKPT